MGESWIVWSEFGAAEKWLVGSVSAATQTEVKGIEGRKGRVLIKVEGMEVKAWVQTVCGIATGF